MSRAHLWLWLWGHFQTPLDHKSIDGVKFNYTAGRWKVGLAGGSGSQVWLLEGQTCFPSPFLFSASWLSGGEQLPSALSESNRVSWPWTEPKQTVPPSSCFSQAFVTTVKSLPLCRSTLGSCWDYLHFTGKQRHREVEWLAWDYSGSNWGPKLTDQCPWKILLPSSPSTGTSW
jgi:hypothetical protein